MASDYTERAPSGLSVRFAASVTIIATATAFGLGLVFGSQQVGAQGPDDTGSRLLNGTSPPAGVDFTPVWRAWEAIDERYVPTETATDTEPVTDQEKVWGLIEGLAASLDDPYTVFLPPSDAEVFQDDISGSFEGVGMEIAIRDNVLTVVSPLRGTPAAEAGIQSGDRIIEIDGVETESMDIDEAVQRIRGPRGTEVVLMVAREGEDELLEIAIERDVINIPTLEASSWDIETGEENPAGAEAQPGDAYVIELLNFSAPSPSLFRQELRAFIESGSDSLILDLRGNPGGYLQAAVEMASWFLPTGEVVVTEDYGGNQSPIVHRSRGYNVFNDNLKMVILVDRGSASASEILAGALRHYGVAELVGTNTFGKGSVQELVDITSDSALKITVARWLDPAGNPIPHDGVEPDVEVSFEEEDLEAGRDPQMQAALEILRNWE